MTHIARNLGAALICAFLWLSVSSAQAAVCNLIFEVIPSKDTAPIIGSKVTARLASKNFAKWRGFSTREAAVVAKFLETNFGKVAKFSKPIIGIGGFEGNSSPSIIITVYFKEDTSGDALGKTISEMTAAIGYTFIQDGMVAFCNTPVGKFGNENPIYRISPGKGFDSDIGPGFVKTAYSAIVDANDNTFIGYSFDGEEMYMLDLYEGRLKQMLQRANTYLAEVFAADVSIAVEYDSDQPSIYLANNWVKDPIGSSLRKYIDKFLYANLGLAQEAYIEALRDFALED